MLVNQPVDPYTLTAVDATNSTRITLSLCPTGLTMHKLLIEADGFDTRDVLCAPELSDSFKEEGRKFMNQIVGRYTNRLPAGKVHIYDSSKSDRNPLTQLNLDENESFPGFPERGNCLHSGANGYDLRDFVYMSPQSNIVKEFEELCQDGISNSNPDQQCHHFYLHSPDGDQGFPEPVDILATVTLQMLTTTKDRSLDVDDRFDCSRGVAQAGFSLRAKLSPKKDVHSSRMTPINLTWHTGYILNNFQQVKPLDGIAHHKLWIDTDRFLAIDNFGLPTGEIQSTKLIGADFLDRDPHLGDSSNSIKDIMPLTGFDHCMLFKESSKDVDPKVVLKSPNNDVALVFRSNQPAVQCYTPNCFDGNGTRKKIHHNVSNESVGGYNKQDAIYLEFQQSTSLCTNLKLQQALKGGHNASNKFCTPCTFAHVMHKELRFY
ncbi:hypothetical protein O181_053658 [Austropuccinia psidii MF-1]|uniref:Uncharacterized protein n=1 Tax=Austropuccinia psidii MF-1 TaxID=1389203 RepID=A0A9Q3E7T6_9BASI|nr:hypothetical protein [Austropuccinia psidii MF-1]